MDEKLNRRPHRLEILNRGTGGVTGMTKTRLSWIQIWGF